MNSAEITAMEEELRRDLEALARVKRIMEAKSVPIAKEIERPINPINNDAVHSDEDDKEDPGISLIGRIEQLINSQPDFKWTTQRVLVQLQKIGFPLRAQKPVYSIGQSLGKLVEQNRIRLAKKGGGSTPNVYKSLIPRQAQPVEIVSFDANGTEFRREGELKFN